MSTATINHQPSTSKQPELALFTVSPEDPRVAALVKYLEEHKGWHLVSEILQEWGLPVTDNNRRLLRACAEVSGGKVIPGQQGYKWTGAGTAEEIDRAANWLKTQGVKMLKRAVAIRREAHRIFG